MFFFSTISKCHPQILEQALEMAAAGLLEGPSFFTAAGTNPSPSVMVLAVFTIGEDVAPSNPPAGAAPSLPKSCAGCRLPPGGHTGKESLMLPTKWLMKVVNVAGFSEQGRKNSGVVLECVGRGTG